MKTQNKTPVRVFQRLRTAFGRMLSVDIRGGDRGMSVRCLTPIILIVALAGCNPFREEGRHLQSADWLPSTASDITFLRETRGFWWQAYECRMARADFETFAAEKGWILTEKVDFGTSMRRVLDLPPVRPSDDGWHPDNYPVALVYERTQSNNGGIQVIYDLEREILFVSQSSH